VATLLVRRSGQTRCHGNRAAVGHTCTVAYLDSNVTTLARHTLPTGDGYCSTCSTSGARARTSSDSDLASCNRVSGGLTGSNYESTTIATVARTNEHADGTALPLVAAPVITENMPLVPLLVVPVLNMIAPLTPVVPAS